MPAADLTARWIGHYEQHDLAFPITAEFTQTGERLTGFMRDGHTEHDYSLYDAVAFSKLSPGSDERIEAEIRTMFPDLPSEPMRAVTHLPTDSLLEGKLVGLSVRFVKTYQGYSLSGYRVGDRFVGREAPGHAVQYEGELSLDGRRIRGKWWIDANPGNLGRVEGAFSLRRG